MKKKLFLIYIIILLLFAISCSSNVAINDNNNDNNVIEGDVVYRLSKTETIYVDGQIKTETYKYDDNGNKIEYKTNEDSKTVITKYEYNKDNKLIKETTTNNNKAIYKKSYTYNDMGFLIKEEWESKDGKGYAIYTYNENGNIFTYSRENNTPSIADDDFYSYTNTYDENYRLIKQEIKSVHSHGIYEWVYGENGLLIKEEYKDEFRKYTLTKTYEYDDEDYLIAEYFTSSDNETGKTSYEYDDNGNKIAEHSEITIMKYHSYLDITWKYDSNNRLIYYEYKISSDLQGFDYNISITYNYDENDNLISEKYNGSGINIIKYEYKAFKK